jgi:hypothetical protein
MPTVDQVLQGLTTIEETVFQTHSFLVTYERHEGVHLSDSLMAGQLPARWTQAFYRDRWYTERRFTRPFTGTYEKGIVKTRVHVPAQPSIHVLKDGVVLEWDQSRNTAKILAFSESGNLYSGLHYTRNLSLDAPKYVARAGDVELAEMRKINRDETDLPFLPEFLRSNRSNYRVLPQQETINGTSCWIVEWPGMDRIAVDPDRGFAIIQRRYSWGPEKPTRVEVTNSDHRQVKPGLWLPYQQQETRYASIVADPKEMWGKAAVKSRYTVQTMRFDDLDDIFFQVKLTPKTRVHDMVRSIQYESAGDSTDPFEEAIAEVLVQAQSARARRVWKGILVGSQLVLFFFITAVVYRRYRTRRGHYGKYSSPSLG